MVAVLVPTYPLRDGSRKPSRDIESPPYSTHLACHIPMTDYLYSDRHAQAIHFASPICIMITREYTYYTFCISYLYSDGFAYTWFSPCLTPTYMYGDRFAILTILCIVIASHFGSLPGHADNLNRLCCNLVVPFCKLILLYSLLSPCCERSIFHIHPRKFHIYEYIVI